MATCEMCGASFPNRKGKRFCHERCKWRAWRERNHETGGRPCYYCGVPADTIDHIPPKSVRPFLLDQGVTRWDFVEVDACRECNSILGARAIWKLEDRKRLIKEALKRRYKRYLRLPKWDSAEFGDMGHSLRTYVETGMVMAEVVRSRISW